MEHIHNTLKFTCEKSKMASFAFSIMKNIVATSDRSRFPVKLIAFGSITSDSCLLKSTVIIL